MRRDSIFLFFWKSWHQALFTDSIFSMIIKWILPMFLLVSLAQGHNNAFLPGDAFFSTALTEEKLADFEDGNTDVLSLTYERLNNDFMACGNLGYFSLKITEVDARFRRNFINAYRKVRGRKGSVFRKNRRDGEVELIEWNPVVALVYNKGEVAEPIGLKFNEDWKEQGHGAYSGFLDDGFSILQDWKRGEKVPALKLATDLVPDAHLQTLKVGGVARGMDEVISLKAADCEIVFVGLLKKNSWVYGECVNLKELAKFSDWRSSDPLPRYVYQINVTSESARYRKFGDDGWEEFLIGRDGQLLPVPKVAPEAVEGAPDEDAGDKSSAE